MGESSGLSTRIPDLSLRGPPRGLRDSASNWHQELTAQTGRAICTAISQWMRHAPIRPVSAHASAAQRSRQFNIPILATIFCHLASKPSPTSVFSRPSTPPRSRGPARCRLVPAGAFLAASPGAWLVPGNAEERRCSDPKPRPAPARRNPPPPGAEVAKLRMGRRSHFASYKTMP